MALPLVPDVTVIDTLQGNELPNALSCPNLFVMRTCFLKDREGETWDEGEGVGLIEKRCCTMPSWCLFRDLYRHQEDITEAKWLQTKT